MQGVLNSCLLLLHLALCGRADVDHRNTAGNLRQTLLKLLAIVIGSGLLDRRLELLDASLDLVLVALTIDDRGGLLVDDDTLGATEIGHDGVLELESDFLRDHLAAGKDSDVLEHCLATITESGSLDR